MNLIKDIKSVIIDIKHNKFAYAFLFFQLVYFSGLVRQFSGALFLITNLIFTLSLCIINHKLSRRDVNFIFVVLAIFTLINLIPFIKWDSSPSLFLGFSSKICLGILIVVYFKNNFYDSFERLVFVLALISLPLFFIQLIHVQIFELFSGLSELVLIDKRLYSSIGQISGHRYLFIFLVNSWAELRNSGFMWEPAAFGAILCWAILINGFINSFSLNSRLSILFFAAISTFSIGTYICLVILILLFLYKNFTKIGIFILLILALSASITYQFDFAKNNIEMLGSKMEDEQRLVEMINADQADKRVSRIGGFVGNIRQIIEEPFGYGLGDKSETDIDLYISPNGLMTLLEFWGIFTLIIILLCTLQLVRILTALYSIKINLFQTFLVILVVILPISGNSFVRQPFLFSILLSGFIITLSYKKQNQL